MLPGADARFMDAAIALSLRVVRPAGPKPADGKSDGASDGEGRRAAVLLQSHCEPFLFLFLLFCFCF